jgi:hypothetical protein
LSQLTLEGITIELDFVNDSPKSITFKDATGRLVRVATDSEYSSIHVTVPAQPKMVDRWAVKGNVCKLSVDETFEYEHEANSRKEELSYADSSAKLEVSKVSVPE